MALQKGRVPKGAPLWSRSTLRSEVSDMGFERESQFETSLDSIFAAEGFGRASVTMLCFVIALDDKVRSHGQG